MQLKGPGNDCLSSRTDIGGQLTLLLDSRIALAYQDHMNFDHIRVNVHAVGFILRRIAVAGMGKASQTLDMVVVVGQNLLLPAPAVFIKQIFYQG